MHSDKHTLPYRRTPGIRSPLLDAMGCLMAVVFLLSIPPPALAGEGLTSWKIDLGMSSVYDDNILRYSDKYLERFDHGEDAGRFQINSKDDLILVSSIRASANLNLIGSLNTMASADVRRRTYTHNSVKDWMYYGVSLRQDLSKKLAVLAGYSYIPNFYVRHYRDDQWVKEFGYTPATFQPFDFTKDQIDGWVQYAITSGTRVRAVTSYMRYYYNEHFTEYNCRNTLYGVEIYQTITKNLKVNGAFSVLYSRADGNAETDASNDENTYVLGADLQLPKVFGHANSIGIEGEYAYTTYTTHNPLEVDINHAGRRDFAYQVSATYGFQLLDNLGLAVAYVWRQRMTRSAALANAVYLADEKDYREYQIGFDVRYSMNFTPSENSELERSR